MKHYKVENRTITFLVAILCISVKMTHACLPDCGDCREFVQGTGCVKDPSVECADYLDCPNNGWCCYCYECSCEENTAWCDSCEKCNECDCECVEVTSISGIAVPRYPVGTSITVTALPTELESYDVKACQVSWRGDASFQITGVRTAIATLETPGVNQTIHAYSACQNEFTAAYSDEFDVVGIINVDREKEWCWEGKTIAITADPFPILASFPDGQPTWDADNGSITGSGSSVTWNAPSDWGGSTMVTATCGDQSASEWVYCARASFQQSVELLREEMKTITPVIVPAYASVLFKENVSPGIAKLYEGHSFLTFENLIDIQNIDALLDSILLYIEGVLPGGDTKILGIVTVNLKKKFSDWRSSVVLPDGLLGLDQIKTASVQSVGLLARQNAAADGFGTTVTNYIGSQAELAMSDYIDDINPFPGTYTEGILNESVTFSWYTYLSMSLNAGDFTIYPENYPGWPEVDPPSVSEFIEGINDHGVSTGLFNITGLPQVGLHLTTSGGQWDVAGDIALGIGDSFGECTYRGTLQVIILLGKD